MNTTIYHHGLSKEEIIKLMSFCPKSYFREFNSDEMFYTVFTLPVGQIELKAFSESYGEKIKSDI
jgi:hypothetical protein